MQIISQSFANQYAKQLATNPNISLLLSNSPQIITQPLYYTIDNLRPFNVPVYVFLVIAWESAVLTIFPSSATAVTFVGLIYLLILSVSSRLLSQNCGYT
jgi:hypothetical protein